MQVKTIWKYSKNSEIQRLAQISAQIGKRFYDKNSFLVLPYLVKNDSKTIFLPPFNYPKNLFKKTAKLKLSIPMKIATALDNSLQKLLPINKKETAKKFDNSNYRTKKSAWQKIENENSAA